MKTDKVDKDNPKKETRHRQNPCSQKTDNLVRRNKNCFFLCNL